MSTFLLVIKIAGIGIGILFGFILLEMIMAVFAPWIKAPVQPMQSGAKSGKRLSPKNRQNVSFKVNDTTIRGWLYLPANVNRPIPCVIMSQGFGGTKDMILESYARRFLEHRMAVLTYDFRHFGESEGEPRQLFDTRAQIEDLRAAIKYARSCKGIDPDRIALWGTSASGGYGLIIAAEDKNIACVIAQCPSLDRHADMKKGLEENGFWFYLRLFVHAQRDKGRSRLGMRPHRIPIVGKPGTLAFHTAPGVFNGYEELGGAESPTFNNETCARVMLVNDPYNPIDFVDKVHCPALLLVCEKDKLVSGIGYKAAAEKMGSLATVREFPIGHFDIYHGEWFERATNEQIEYLQQHLHLREQQ